MKASVDFFGKWLFALAIAVFPLFGQPKALSARALDIERSGTLQNVIIRKEAAGIVTNARLSFDLDWLYRASVLAGAPLVNCGIRLRNLSGTVDLNEAGKPAQIAVTESNAHLVSVVDIGLVMQTGVLNEFTAIPCPGGLVGTESQPVWGVPSAYDIGQTFCWHGYNAAARGALPDRLGADWCIGGLGGRFMPEERARELFASQGGGSARFHERAYPVVVAASFGFHGLIAEWRRQEQEKAKAQAQEALQRDEDAAERDEAEEKKAEERRARLQSMLSRAASGSDTVDIPPAGAGTRGNGFGNRLSASLMRAENERQRGEATARLADLEEERARLETRLAETRQTCEDSKPRFHVAVSTGPVLTLTASSPPCTPDECRAREERRRAEAEREKARARERAAEYARREAQRRADHAAALSRWEAHEGPACLARAQDEYMRATQRLNAEETTARRVLASPGVAGN